MRGMVRNAKISAALIGNHYALGKHHKLSEETRKRMSIAQKGHKGWKPSPEAIRKAADANRGRKRSEETKRKISEALKGRKISTGTRQKIAHAHICNPALLDDILSAWPFETSGIYRITQKDTGRCYIGSAVNLRSRGRGHLGKLRRGKHENTYLQRAWAKYGEDAFVFEILEEVIDKSDLINREQHYIDIAQLRYNHCPTAGSTLGVPASAENRHKTTERLRKSWSDAEYRARMIEFRSHPSAETRKRWSEASKGHTHNTEEMKRATSERTKAWYAAMTPDERKARSVAANKHIILPREERSCPVCGKVFLAVVGRDYPKYCSRACYQPCSGKYERSDQQRQKMSENTKRLWSDPGYRQQITSANKGQGMLPREERPCPICGKVFLAIVGHKDRKYCSHICYSKAERSEESRRKMSAASKGNQHRLGQHPTEETRQKMSISHIGRVRAPAKVTA